MKSIMKRQFFLTAGLILLSFLLLGCAVIPLSYRLTMAEKQESMLKNAEFVSRLTSTSLARGYSIYDSDFRLQISYSSLMADASILICETDGLIVYSSDRGSPSGYAGRYVPEVAAATLFTDGSYAALTDLGGLYPVARYVVGTPIYSFSGQSSVIGLIFISAGTGELSAIWLGIAKISALIAAGVLVITFVSTWITSARQTRPLKELAIAAREFGHGNLHVRVSDYGRRDEIGELASAFNTMAESLEQSEARRRDFIANLSHELKTPMTTISGYTDGILDGTIPPERLNQSLRTISDEARRLSRLVQRMLELSRLGEKERTFRKKPFEIAEVMRRVLLSLEGKINDRGLDVDVRIPDDPVYVSGDADSILQVGYNLLDNAIKFSPPKGTIGVEIRVQGNRAFVSVRNQGPEIPPEELPLIFDRFHKADRSRSMDREGVGLGLYIVKTILDQHRETIGVTSENGRTEFTFSLTLAG